MLQDCESLVSVTAGLKSRTTEDMKVVAFCLVQVTSMEDLLAFDEKFTMQEQKDIKPILVFDATASEQDVLNNRE